MKQLQILEREKDLKMGQVRKTENKAKQVGAEVLGKELAITSLKKELHSSKDQLERLNLSIMQFDKSRDRNIAVIAQQRVTNEAVQRDIYLRDAEITGLKVNMRDLAIQLQRKKVETKRLRGDCANHSKRLAELRGEMEK